MDPEMHAGSLERIVGGLPCGEHHAVASQQRRAIGEPDRECSRHAERPHVQTRNEARCRIAELREHRNELLARRALRDDLHRLELRVTHDPDCTDAVVVEKRAPSEGTFRRQREHEIDRRESVLIKTP
jgi:hypothetical protein